MKEYEKSTALCQEPLSLAAFQAFARLFIIEKLGLLLRISSPVDNPTQNPEAELTAKWHSSLNIEGKCFLFISLQIKRSFSIMKIEVTFLPQTLFLGGKPAQQLGNMLTEDLSIVSWMEIFLFFTYIKYCAWS